MNIEVSFILLNNKTVEARAYTAENHPIDYSSSATLSLFKVLAFADG
jgi:hypothetical protein